MVAAAAWIAHTQSFNTGSSIQVAQSSGITCPDMARPLLTCEYDTFISGEELSGTVGKLGWGVQTWVSVNQAGGLVFVPGQGFVYYNSPSNPDPATGDPTNNRHPGVLGLDSGFAGVDGDAGFLFTYTIANDGTGYSVNDVLTFVGGDNNATLTVDTVSGGGDITSSHRTDVGTSYGSILGATVALSGGTGTTATATITGVVPGYSSTMIIAPAGVNNLSAIGNQFYPGTGSWTVRFEVLGAGGLPQNNSVSQFAVGINGNGSTPTLPPLQILPDPVDFQLGASSYFLLDTFNEVGNPIWHFRNEWTPPGFIVADTNTGVAGLDNAATEQVFQILEIRKVAGEALLHFRIYDDTGAPLMADMTTPFPSLANFTYPSENPFALVIGICPVIPAQVQSLVDAYWFTDDLE